MIGDMVAKEVRRGPLVKNTLKLGPLLVSNLKKLKVIEDPIEPK